MNRDPDQFPDYDAFRPERYLDASEELAAPMPNTHGQGHMTFGSGRRYIQNQFCSRSMTTNQWAVKLVSA